MNDYFAICVRPEMPVILGRRLNLCALLGYQLLNQLRDQGVDDQEAIQRANRDIPLAQSHGVFCGSSALIARCPTSYFTVIGSLERHLVAIPDVEIMLEKNIPKRKTSREFDRVNKRYQNILTRYEQYHIETDQGIWFAAYGDRAKIEELLTGLRVIGTKRRQVSSVDFYDAEPSAHPGLVGHDGTVLRPVPCSSGLTVSKFAIADERYRPPYWQGEQERCYVPPRVTWDNVGQITRAIGASQ